MQDKCDSNTDLDFHIDRRLFLVSSDKLSQATTIANNQSIIEGRNKQRHHQGNHIWQVRMDKEC